MATTSVKSLSVLLISLAIVAAPVRAAAAEDAAQSVTVGIEHKGDVYIVMILSYSA